MAYSTNGSGTIKLNGHTYPCNPAADIDAFEYGALNFATLTPHARKHLQHDIANAYTVDTRTAMAFIKSIRNTIRRHNN